MTTNINKLEITDLCPSEALTMDPNVDYPTPQKVVYYSSTTNTGRPLNVVLPLNYSPSKKYPVLYVLHGLFGNEDSMVDEDLGLITIATNLIREGKAKEMIIVSPNEYAPPEGKSVPASPTPAHFEGYNNFIHDLVDNIMPYVKSHYSVATGRENTAICGFSMGGRNSLYIGYQRPDLFGYVAAFSPAPGVTPGKDFNGTHKGLMNEEELRAEPSLLVSSISCGTNDRIVGEFPKKYHTILERNGQPHIWYEIPDADHDHIAITTGFHNFISSIFGILN
ncbi:carbohydrate esterase family 1 protein [Piromyces sp. E2]|nr:carbohydrate esterase family 1 protein [Piromyces sp. E2]|eukprot:OUM58471.1 carbohydrate esterase family 1 protein [Piromyces sp. E2]